MLVITAPNIDALPVQAVEIVAQTGATLDIQFRLPLYAPPAIAQLHFIAKRTFADEDGQAILHVLLDTVTPANSGLVVTNGAAAVDTVTGKPGAALADDSAGGNAVYDMTVGFKVMNAPPSPDSAPYVWELAAVTTESPARRLSFFIGTLTVIDGVYARRW